MTSSLSSTSAAAAAVFFHLPNPLRVPAYQPALLSPPMLYVSLHTYRYLYTHIHSYMYRDRYIDRYLFPRVYMAASLFGRCFLSWLSWSESILNSEEASSHGEKGNDSIWRQRRKEEHVLYQETEESWKHSSKRQPSLEAAHAQRKTRRGRGRERDKRRLESPVSLLLS